MGGDEQLSFGGGAPKERNLKNYKAAIDSAEVTRSRRGFLYVMTVSNSLFDRESVNAYIIYVITLSSLPSEAQAPPGPFS